VKTGAAGRVVALARPEAVSGVAVAVARMASLMPEASAWTPLVIGPELTKAVLGRSPWSEAGDVQLATWSADASPVEQVLTVLRRLRELNAHVVVPNDCFHGFVAAGIDHLAGLRCAMWLHADHLDGDEIVERCGQLADSFRAVSAEGRARAVALADRIEISLPRMGEPCPAVVAVPATCTGIGPVRDRLAILYAGRLEKQVKRVLDLVRLADALGAAGTPFEMRIVGDGPCRGELAAGMAPHIAMNRVVLMGAVPLEQMQSIYGWADVTVLVSGSEGMPTVVLESLANGRPVLVSDRCGGATQLVARERGRFGQIFPVGAVETAADILTDWSMDRALLAQMGREAHAMALARFGPVVRAPDFTAFVAEARNAPQRWDPRLPVEAGLWWGRLRTAIEAIGPCSPQDLVTLAREWLKASGVESSGAFVPGSDLLPLSLPGIMSPTARLVRAALDRLLARGVKRIAVYGAGLHTRRMLSLIRSVPQVVAVVDDRAGFLNGPPTDIGGLPVIAPSAAVDHAIDAVLVSSDEHEREMLVRAQTWAVGIPVEPVYEGVAKA